MQGFGDRPRAKRKISVPVGCHGANPAAGFQNARQFGRIESGVGDVFKHHPRRDHIETCIREWQSVPDGREMAVCGHGVVQDDRVHVKDSVATDMAGYIGDPADRVGFLFRELPPTGAKIQDGAIGINQRPDAGRIGDSGVIAVKAARAHFRKNPFKGFGHRHSVSNAKGSEKQQDRSA